MCGEDKREMSSGNSLERKLGRETLLIFSFQNLDT